MEQILDQIRSIPDGFACLTFCQPDEWLQPAFTETHTNCLVVGGPARDYMPEEFALLARLAERFQRAYRQHKHPLDRCLVIAKQPTFYGKRRHRWLGGWSYLIAYNPKASELIRPTLAQTLSRFYPTERDLRVQPDHWLEGWFCNANDDEPPRRFDQADSAMIRLTDGQRIMKYRCHLAAPSEDEVLELRRFYRMEKLATSVER